MAEGMRACYSVDLEFVVLEFASAQPQPLYVILSVLAKDLGRRNIFRLPRSFAEYRSG